MASKRSTGEAADVSSRVLDREAASAFASLRTALAGSVEEPTEGYRTTVQWADAWQVSRPHAGMLIRNGVLIGKVHSKKFRIPTAGGLKPISHYKVD